MTKITSITENIQHSETLKWLQTNFPESVKAFVGSTANLALMAAICGFTSLELNIPIFSSKAGVIDLPVSSIIEQEPTATKPNNSLEEGATPNVTQQETVIVNEGSELYWCLLHHGGASCEDRDNKYIMFPKEDNSVAELSEKGSEQNLRVFPKKVASLYMDDTVTVLSKWVMDPEVKTQLIVALVIVVLLLVGKFKK